MAPWPVPFAVSVPVALWRCSCPCRGLAHTAAPRRLPLSLQRPPLPSGGYLAVALVFAVVVADTVGTARHEMHKVLQHRWRGFFAINSKPRTLCPHRKELRHPQVQRQMRKTINCKVSVRRWYHAPVECLMQSRKLSEAAPPAHSLENPTTGISVGLCFGDNSCIVKSGSGTTPPTGLRPVSSDLVSSHSAVLFFASCKDSSTFDSIWGITSSTQRRALIVPQFGVDVDLNVGARGWLYAASSLARGQDAGVAKGSANDGVLFRVGNTFTWKVIGDSSTTITKPH